MPTKTIEVAHRHVMASDFNRVKRSLVFHRPCSRSGERHSVRGQSVRERRGAIEIPAQFAYRFATT